MNLDIEQRFICALLHASRNQQETFYERQFPQRLFRIREPEISWVYEYRERKGRYPSTAIFFSRFKWAVKKVSEPWTDLLDAIAGQEHYRQIKQVVETTRDFIEKGVPMPKVVQHFKNASQRITEFDIDSEDIDVATSKASLMRYAKMKKLRTQKGGSLFRTPWPSVNKIIKFCRPEDFVVLVGRLGMGKSWILLFWAVWLADQGHSVLFVSKEMGLDAIEDRIESIRFLLDFEKFRAGEMTAADELKWRRMRLKKQTTNLKITGKETIEGTGIGEVVSKIRKYRPQIVLVDAAYRIVLDDTMKRKSETEKLTYVAQTCKRIAKAEKVLLVATTQMNREAEDAKGNTKGGVRTVFGADAWAQEADFMFEVHGNRNEPALRGLTLLKGRESGTGTVMIQFQVSPFPSFKEANVATTPNSTVKFKAI